MWILQKKIRHFRGSRNIYRLKKFYLDSHNFSGREGAERLLWRTEGRMQVGQRVHMAGLKEHKKRPLPTVYSNRSNQLKITQQFDSALNPKVKDWGSELCPFCATYSKTSLSWNSHCSGNELGGGLSQKDETICPAHRIQKTKMAAMKAWLTWTLVQCRLDTATLTLYVSIVCMLWQNTW